MLDTNASSKTQYKIGGSICVAIGVLFILWALNVYYYIPKESDLIVASGVATAFEEKEHPGRNGTTRSLTFRLEGHPAKYADHSSHYDEIAGALRVDQPVKAWLSPKSEAIFPVTEFVPIYKFERDGQTILTYQEAVEDEMIFVRFAGLFGVIFVGLGIFFFSMLKWLDRLAALRESYSK